MNKNLKETSVSVYNNVVGKCLIKIHIKRDETSSTYADITDAVVNDYGNVILKGKEETFEFSPNNLLTLINEGHYSYMLYDNEHKVCGAIVCILIDK